MGEVDTARGTAFLKTLSSPQRSLTAAEILAYAHQHREQLRCWIETRRLDLVAASLLEIKKNLQYNGNYQLARSDDGAWQNLGLFLADLPGDLREDAQAFFQERQYDIPVACRGT
jgi:hypothetical protein